MRRSELFLVLAGSAGALALAGCGGGDTTSGGSCSGLIAGDLVISEIMAAPRTDEAEWFEIYNASGTDLDLAGLTLLSRKVDGTAEKRHVVSELMVSANRYVVVGDAFSTTLPAYVNYGYGKALGALVNSGGQLALKCGDVVVDEVTYAAQTTGESWSLSGGVAPDYLRNDDQLQWCDATSEFISTEPTSLGTPGDANDTCQGLVPTTCNDGGTPREVVPPGAGGLVITEFMPSPVSPQAGREWFEVLVTADADLNGLKIAKTLDATGASATVLQSDDCLRVTAGTYLVFGHGTDAAANGGLPRVDVVFTKPDPLAASGSLNLSIGGALIDEIQWTGAPNGASVQLSSTAPQTAAGNDDATAFCPSTATYGAGGKGTPGAANVECPLVVPAGMCLDGGTPRQVMALGAGDVVITEAMGDPKSPITDTDGEWFEVLVKTAGDLNGLQVKYNGAVKQTFSAADCLPVAAGKRLLFARSDVPETNGGLPPVDYTFAFNLAATGTLGVAVAGVDLDAFQLGGVVADPGRAIVAGKSTQVKPASETPEGNDLADSTCVAAAPGQDYGAGGAGTPGAANVCQ